MQTRFAHQTLILCLLIAWLGSFYAAYAHAQQDDDALESWRVALRPASNNLKPDVRLIAGYEQILVAQLQSRRDLFTQQPSQTVELVVHTPAGMKLRDVQSFIYKIRDFQPTQDDAQPARFKADVRANGIVGQPGEPLNSDWRGMALIVDVPPSLPADATLRIDLIWQGQTFTHEWPVQALPLDQPGLQPKRMRLGLWTYNWDRAGSRGSQIARFLKTIGINAVQGDRFHRQALEAGIETGGSVHHSPFFDERHPNLDAHGKINAGSFADPQAIIDWPREDDVNLPGLRKMIETADQYAGRVTIDYEPNPSRGFTPRGIAAFKQRHAITDADFDTFLQAMRTHGRQTYLKADPAVMATYRQWVTFRSWQAENYIARYRQALDRHRPGTHFRVTTVVSHTPGAITTLGRGLVASQMAPHVDAILPQIYNGYDAAAARLVGMHAQGWRQALDAQQADTLLQPILMVRYAGAVEPLLNAPDRLRQQALLCLVEGSDGVIFYYPANMDGPYWQMLARLSREMHTYESFYLDGQRQDQDDWLDASALPRRVATMRVWPGHEETIPNPDWHATAHRLGDQTLFTLFNLSEDQPLVFNLRGSDRFTTRSHHDAHPQGPGQWRVPPGRVAHVLVSHTSRP